MFDHRGARDGGGHHIPVSHMKVCSEYAKGKLGPLKVEKPWEDWEKKLVIYLHWKNHWKMNIFSFVTAVTSIPTVTWHFDHVLLSLVKQFRISRSQSLCSGSEYSSLYMIQRSVLSLTVSWKLQLQSISQSIIYKIDCASLYRMWCILFVMQTKTKVWIYSWQGCFVYTTFKLWLLLKEPGIKTSHPFIYFFTNSY